MGGQASGLAHQGVPVGSRDALTIARIVRVNHAGEFGAIRIYSAQLLVSGWFWPDCSPALAEMLRHERNHCAIFYAAMPPRQSRPCRVMHLSRLVSAGREYGRAPLRWKPRCTGTSTISFISSRTAIASCTRSFSRSGKRNLHICGMPRRSFHRRARWSGYSGGSSLWRLTA